MGERTGVEVHAVATALAGAVPVPFVGGYAQALTRGAAFRRIARAHGVRLTGGARDALAAPWGSAGRTSGLVRLALRRVAAPLLIASRLEQATRLLLDARLFDHYLAVADARGWRQVEGTKRGPMSRAEAERIRAALAAAPGGSLRGLVREIGPEARRALGEVQDGSEERNPLERLVDGALEFAASLPEDAVDGARARFEQALESAR